MQNTEISSPILGSMSNKAELGCPNKLTRQVTSDSVPHKIQFWTKYTSPPLVSHRNSSPKIQTIPPSTPCVISPSQVSSIHVPGWSLVPSSASLAVAAWSHLLEVKQLLQHLQSWRTPTLSLMCHTQTQSSRELSDHTRKSKTPQNSEITKAQEQMLTAVKSLQSRP